MGKIWKQYAIIRNNMEYIYIYIYIESYGNNMADYGNI